MIVSPPVNNGMHICWNWVSKWITIKEFLAFEVQNQGHPMSIVLVGDCCKVSFLAASKVLTPFPYPTICTFSPVFILFIIGSGKQSHESCVLDEAVISFHWEGFLQHAEHDEFMVISKPVLHKIEREFMYFNSVTDPLELASPGSVCKWIESFLEWWAILIPFHLHFEVLNSLPPIFLSFANRGKLNPEQNNPEWVSLLASCLEMWALNWFNSATVNGLLESC